MTHGKFPVCFAAGCMACQLLASVACAGPPFLTDDPVPVAYRHWEFYLASIQQYQREESDATLPHIEINYGPIPNVQLHLVLPMQYVHGMDGTKYGYSNTELEKAILMTKKKMFKHPTHAFVLH